LRFIAKSLVTLLITTLAVAWAPTAANSSSACDSLESSLRWQISNSSTLSPITSAASSFRDCMALQADSWSVGTKLTASSSFYSIFTSLTVYNYIGRSIALAAAADYRYHLDGLSPWAQPTSNCDIYLNLVSRALSIGDIGLASIGQNAHTSCYAQLQVPARGTITISGSSFVGDQLSARVQGSFSRVGLWYQWYANGSSIWGATSSAYTPTESQAGQDITVRITFTGSGLTSVTRSSSSVRVQVRNLTLTPTPTISGTAQVGNTLSAQAGTWDSGVALSYQWLRGGSEISNELSSSYTLTPSDGGHNISVRVTGSKQGFATTSRTSNPVSVPLKLLTLSPSPTISGNAQVMSTVTAQTGTWDSGVSFTYQWLRNGVNISSGSTGSSYVVSLSDAGQELSVRVTGSKLGFASISRVSSAVRVPLMNLSSTPTPTITGTAQVGNELTTVTGTWDSGVSFAYQWLRNGVSIAGATNSTYGVTTADAGHSISVRVTGSKSSYFLPVARTSSTLPIPLQSQTLSPTPLLSISDSDNQLTAAPGNWDSGVALSYQWLRNNVAIPNAIGNSYNLTTSDVGKSVSVRVTGSKTGFTPITRVSEALVFRALSRTPTPLIVGTARVGNGLSVKTGTWDSGVSFSYLWLRGGAAISGATGSTYTLTSDDAGQAVSVRVTASKSSHLKVVRTSTTVSIPLQTLALSPNPTITGNAELVGNELSANTGTWDSGVSFSYQWLRGGVVISGATGSTYTLTSLDVAKAMSVQVRGSKSGFTPIVRTSGTVSVPLQTMTLSPEVEVMALSGDAVVLMALPGIWDSGVSLSCQWLRNGSAISNARGCLYTATSSDGGHNISVRVTGSKPGYFAVAKTSNPFSVPRLSRQPSPSITGVAGVGNTLTAEPGNLESGVSLKYEWLRNGKIAGLGSTYSLETHDAGARFSVRVTATLAGHAPAVVLSATTPRVAAATRSFAGTATPVISGVARLGQTLTVSNIKWTPSPQRLSIQWLRKISTNRWQLIGTGPTYVLTSDDLRKQIHVEVKGHRPGYNTRYATSRVITVPAG